MTGPHVALGCAPFSPPLHTIPNWMTSAQYPVCYQWDYAGMLTTGNLLSQGLTNSHLQWAVTQRQVMGGIASARTERWAFYTIFRNTELSPGLSFAVSHRVASELAADHCCCDWPTWALSRVCVWPSRVCVYTRGGKKSRQQSLTLPMSNICMTPLYQSVPVGHSRWPSSLWGLPSLPLLKKKKKLIETHIPNAAVTGSDQRLPFIKREVKIDGQRKCVLLLMRPTWRTKGGSVWTCNRGWTVKTNHIVKQEIKQEQEARKVFCWYKCPSYVEHGTVTYLHKRFLHCLDALILVIVPH